MINPFTEVNWKPGPAEIRKFAISFVIGFPCIAVVLLIARRVLAGEWRLESALWLGGVGLGAGLVFLAIGVLAKPFYLLWYFLACCIGIVISNVLFMGFFFLVVTPLGLLLRILGKRPIQTGFDKSAKTYWRDVERVTDVKRYFSQF